MSYSDFQVPNKLFTGSVNLWRIVYQPIEEWGDNQFHFGPDELMRLKAVVEHGENGWEVKHIDASTGWKPKGESFDGYFPVKYNAGILYFKEAIDAFELYVKNWCDERNKWAIEM